MTRRTPAVAVIDPQTPGNVGTIARAMKNFGFEDLLLIDAPELDPDGEAYGFAGQAREDILPEHDRPTFDELVESYYTIGFTATTHEDSTRHVRYPFVTPKELASELATVDARPVLVFGREGSGLSNAELAQMDRICAIPASDSYPSLNLGQAATIALYELRDLTGDPSQLPDPELERASEPALERLYEAIETYLAAIGHPEPKRPKAARMMRRVIARAHPTEREAKTMMGLFRRGTKYAEPPGSTEETDGNDQTTPSE